MGNSIYLVTIRRQQTVKQLGNVVHLLQVFVEILIILQVNQMTIKAYHNYYYFIIFISFYPFINIFHIFV